MSEITYNEYWKEISSVAEEIVSEAMTACDNDRDSALESIYDNRLHEWIDSHQWVIYYSYNLDVIKHSDNEDYFSDNFGSESLGASLEQGGLDMLHCHIAFWCMYADVSNKIESAMDDYETESEECA